MTRIQHVEFLPHHLDGPGDIPNCKGFALVTFSSKEDVEYLLEHWPWEKVPLPTQGGAQRSELTKRNSTPEQSNPEDGKKEKEKRRGRSGCPEAVLARNRGLRVCTKIRWGKLREEYIAYGQRLANELGREQDESRNKGKEPLQQLQVESNSNVEANKEGPPIGVSKQDEPKPPQGKKRPHSEIEATAIVKYGFPAGCILFVRDVHYATNKTTLKKLFSRPWQSKTNNLAYVDYAKNMDGVRLILIHAFYQLLLTIGVLVLRAMLLTISSPTICQILFIA